MRSLICAYKVISRVLDFISTCSWSIYKVPPDLNWARRLQECQQKPCHRTCSPKSPKTYTELTPLQERYRLCCYYLMSTVSVNSSIRQGSLSAWEMLIQRDQFTDRQLPISDPELNLRKHQTRNANQESSERSKAPHLKQSPNPSEDVGDLVYIYYDKEE